MLPIFHLLHISGVMEMMSKEGEVGVNTGNDYKGKKVRVCDLVLRALGLVFTLVAAVLVGVDKQTKVVGVQLIDTLPPVNVPVSAKYHYLSAFVYFVVVNAIATGYAGMSVAVTVVHRKGGGRSKGLERVMRLMDAVMVGLLFSACGATIALGVMGFRGNSHLNWHKVCNVFTRFCHQVAAACLFSLLGSLTFLLLLLLPALRAIY
ncbi:CASP-like protein 1E1 isoform X1 [Neltuma alba]|uniref:CASP-like protein 1E1 isoform X1 n=1 Tax=Neltuma alba TaxID=207710 RepID=UPI0010A3BF9C|nr:CASP-like protein 1E1 isoform X1 [Prosopis alba]